jgi:molybdopterin-guanine dinucleotide biosynthesis protein A
VVAAALVVVVALTEATALLPCAAAMVAPLVATLPEVEATVVVTVAVAVPAVATTLTEQRLARTEIDTVRALRSRRLQPTCGKYSRRTKIPTASRQRQRRLHVFSQRERL